MYIYINRCMPIIVIVIETIKENMRRNKIPTFVENKAIIITHNNDNKYIILIFFTILNYICYAFTNCLKKNKIR